MLPFWLLWNVMKFLKVDTMDINARLGTLAAEELTDFTTVKGDDEGSPGLDLRLRVLS